MHLKSKIPSSKLTKEMKDLYAENCKTLMKEIEEDMNRKIFCDFGLEELIQLKCPSDSVHSLSKNNGTFHRN